MVEKYSYQPNNEEIDFIPNARKRGWQPIAGGWQFITNKSIENGEVPFVEKFEDGYHIGLFQVDQRRKAFAYSVYGSLEDAADEAENLIGENIDRSGYEIYDLGSRIDEVEADRSI